MILKILQCIYIFFYREQPDIVFFQEMIPETFSYVEEKLPEYMCIAGNTDGYFVATLLRRFTVYYDSHSVKPHPGSLMMRNMLIIQVILMYYYPPIVLIIFAEIHSLFKK